MSKQWKSLWQQKFSYNIAQQESRPAIAQQLVKKGSHQPATEAAESKSMREQPYDTSDATCRQKNRRI